MHARKRLLPLAATAGGTLFVLARRGAAFRERSDALFLTLPLVGRLALGANAAGLPFIVAPMGASAVLLFAVPSSPLAQPWPTIGGHLSAAAIGLACHMLLGPGWLAASLAVGLAVAVMSLPHRFQTRPGKLPAQVPYLQPTLADVLAIFQRHGFARAAVVGRIEAAGASRLVVA